MPAIMRTDRVIDHGFVVDGHQLFADGSGDGVESCAGAAGEDYAFHFLKF